jgi:hypothetical protein
MRVTLSFTIILLGLTVCQPATAATIAVELGSGGFENANYGSNSTLGWGFTLTAPLTVIDLGYYDGGDAGLIDPHPVGVWDSAGDLLATATVPSGTAATLMSGFRFVAIAPLLLGPGAFTIGAYANATSPDPFRWQVPSVTTVAGLSFGTANLFIHADTLARPTTPADVFGPSGYFGPNFLVGTPTAIPEPGAIGTTLTGLAVMIGVLSCKAKAGARKAP